MTQPQPEPRLPVLDVDDLSPPQRDLLAAISGGPRGNVGLRGPFAIWMHAPAYGHVAQQIGAYCRFGTSVPPRLSEFAILVTGQHWRAQFEWYAHAPIAERAGVSPATIAALRTGERPSNAPEDELAIYDFIHELYATKRVSDATYARVHKLFGDGTMVEFVGILGHYASISMTLNVFRAPIPDASELPFPEPST